jgi:hypothetical protein
MVIYALLNILKHFVIAYISKLYVNQNVCAGTRHVTSKY